jgi:uncharacterized protein (TIGR02453 family)
MGFSGLSAEAVEFFRGLEADNTKAYWTTHKACYETSVREPMTELLSELSAEFGPARIARPYRDVRFRADKSPYKTEIYASFDHGGYVRFSGDGLTAASGYFMMTPDQLQRYRDAVDREADGTELAAEVERLRAAGLEVAGSQSLKTAPRGYRKDHPRLDLLRCKGLICWRHWPVAPWLHTGKARDQVAGVLRTAAPLHQWLDRNVGPATG